MRILVVNNLYPPVVRGGYEVECAGVVDRLRAEGHDVLVLTSDERTAAGEVPPAEPGVRRELPFLEYRRADSLRAASHARRGAATMRATLGAFDPQLVYVWNGAQIPHSALRVAALSGRPLAYRVCEHWFGRLYSGDRYMRHLDGGERGARAIWGAAMRGANRLPGLRVDLRTRERAAICWNSRAMRRMNPMPPQVEPVLEEVIFPATRQGARLATIERRPEPGGPPVIAFVGRVEPQKGLDVAFRALAALRDEHGIEARLRVAGAMAEGMAEPMAALAAELGIARHVDLLGHTDFDGISELLSTAHALVVPPTWQEPAGLVCVEAALARVPVVAARSGGIPEMLHDGEHALLFPIGDAAAAAAALATTLTDRESTDRRVRAAFAHVQDFTIDRYMDRTLAFIDRTMSAFARPPGPARPDSRRI